MNYVLISCVYNCLLDFYLDNLQISPMQYVNNWNHFSQFQMWFFWYVLLHHHPFGSSNQILGDYFWHIFFLLIPTHKHSLTDITSASCLFFKYFLFFTFYQCHFTWSHYLLLWWLQWPSFWNNYPSYTPIQSLRDHSDIQIYQLTSFLK